MTRRQTLRMRERSYVRGREDSGTTGGRKSGWRERTGRRGENTTLPPYLVETAISERTSRRRRNRALWIFYISGATADAMASTVVRLEVVAYGQTRPPREERTSTTTAALHSRKIRAIVAFRRPFFAAGWSRRGGEELRSQQETHLLQREDIGGGWDRPTASWPPSRTWSRC